MTILRFLIYTFGGIFLTTGYVLLILNRPEHSGELWELCLFAVIGWAALVALDRWIHGALYGHRVKFNLEKYTPCPICPLTGETATEKRLLLYQEQLIGPVHATIERRLPILISTKAAKGHPTEALAEISGFRIIRFSPKQVILYIHDKKIYDAFITANERALVN